ncbi:hypothetical protein PR202_gb16851 [Eleusine coracana subsp. coracana]|uniref:BRCT domain-containing protein n=1 Tax=Eleusine coracana subsp. coracana TaxID=191504 RepID=A0AAV5EZ52_ELECO|nr:hypothetical protein PR202_gb16851 [Eleusine coracana subsp. coracana]
MTPSFAPVPAGPTGARRAATFAGASVFLSRNLVAPEVFDAVHDALRLNGAEVFLCADPGRTGPLDFHVISSSSHAKIGELVTAMGGLLQTNSSTDVNFVIVKDVMAAKYKWAVDTLKKPVVTLNWLEQCWIEHRVVPHEPYRIPPFTGLNICVTRLNQDEQKKLQKVVLQNGGQFSTCLTKKCTHLVANISFGAFCLKSDKYVVAKRWGNIHIVNPRWVEQCVARRACVDENSYLICESSSAPSGIKGSLKEQHNPEISSASASFQPVPTTSVDDSVSTSQFVPASLGDAAKNNNTDIVGASSVQETNQMQVDSHAIVDSEAENDDLYLSNCRISLVGFDDKEMLRLVMMIRNGGGSRHILLSERLTHIVLGAPFRRVGHMQDVRDHLIFTPLRCHIPFPGFGNFRFCISQYEEKETSLLKNLCFALGVKYTVKASKKVTHHICKFAIGQMYEIYCKRGIPTITAEWLFECVKQDAIVPFDDFQPKPLTSQDKDAGLYTASQYSTQGARFDCSQLLSGCQVTRSNPTHKSGVAAANEESCPPAVNKRRKLSVPSKAGDTRENIGRTDRQLHSSSVPDVADAIEVLSSKASSNSCILHSKDILLGRYVKMMSFRNCRFRMCNPQGVYPIFLEIYAFL